MYNTADSHYGLRLLVESLMLKKPLRTESIVSSILNYSD